MSQDHSVAITATETDIQTKETKSGKILFNVSLVKAISETLTMLIEESKKLSAFKVLFKKHKKTSFYYSKPPKISLFDYICRIMEFTKINESTMILAVIYLDRLFNANAFIMTEFNIHRLVFASVIAAIKFNEDVFLKNTYYAQVAGVTKKELFTMEEQLLSLLDYKLFVDGALFHQYKDFLMHFFMKC